MGVPECPSLQIYDRRDQTVNPTHMSHTSLLSPPQADHDSFPPADGISELTKHSNNLSFMVVHDTTRLVEVRILDHHENIQLYIPSDPELLQTCFWWANKSNSFTNNWDIVTKV